MMRLGLLALLALPLQAAPDAADLVAEVRHLRGQVVLLESLLAQRDQALEGMRKDVRALADEVGALKDRATTPVAGPFLSAPPPSSDAVGVAKVAVFAPRVEVDAKQRHDLVTLRVRRLEPGGARPVGELDLGTDQDGVELPLDQNGALYVVDWTTSEGFTHALVLRDGATRQAAATVQVKPQEREGRFIFVGYRVD